MKCRRLGTWIVCIALLAVVDHGWTADGRAAGSTRAPDVVTLNFVNADIEGVVKAVSEITGRNFVLDPRVKGTINIVSAKPMSRNMVYQVFLSAIRLQGFTALEEGGTVMIVPETEAKMRRSPTFGPQERMRTSGDSIQTKVFKLQHATAAQMVAVLRPLIPANNTISAYSSNNTLVITDYASNLGRLEKIIDSIDQPNQSDSIFIPLQHASAIDVAQTIGRLLTEPGQQTDPTHRFTVAADARSNSVIARAGDTARLARVSQLIAMLDAATTTAGNIHVVYLKNAQAVKVAEVLRAIYTGESAPATAAPRTTASPLTSATQQTTSQTTQTVPGIIQADAATNSIIITAPDAIYKNLRAALEKLDVRRAQVYVEALIAEVAADKASEFGIQWQSLGGLGKGDRQGFGGTNFGTSGQNIIGLSTDPSSVGRGLNVGIVNGTVTIPGIGEILNLNVLVRALQTDGNTNILATPTLLTLDNEEAKIVIGSNVPFITGQYAVSAAATTPTPFQTIERKDVGLTLRVKPQVSEGGSIRMQIFQEVSLVTDTTNPAGLITNKRAVESTVLIDDGQIVVIGGLIQDTVRDTVEKVPGLGDLPLLGGLFRYNTRSRSKVNLMVFLRPVVLRDAMGSETISRERYDYILGQQRNVKPLPGVMPDFGTPILPPRQGTPAEGTEAPAAPAQ